MTWVHPIRRRMIDARVLKPGRDLPDPNVGAGLPYLPEDEHKPYRPGPPIREFDVNGDPHYLEGYDA